VDLPDTARAGLCFGYFLAILGATLFSNANNTRVLGICTPERENSHQMARVVARFVETNPQYADNRAIAMVLSALKQAYACPASQEPTRGRCSRGHHRYIRGAERPVRTGSQTLLRRTQGEHVSFRVLPTERTQWQAVRLPVHSWRAPASMARTTRFPPACDVSSPRRQTTHKPRIHSAAQTDRLRRRRSPGAPEVQAVSAQPFCRQPAEQRTRRRSEAASGSHQGDQGVVCGRGRDPTLSGPVVLAGQRDVLQPRGETWASRSDIRTSPAAVRTIGRFFKQTRPFFKGETKVGRNDPCFCSSGKTGTVGFRPLPQTTP